MSGRKLFINGSGNQLNVTAYNRLSSDPARTRDEVTFTLQRDEHKMVTYGNDQNPYLNGFNLIAVRDGSIISQTKIVITRGSPLDNQLNMHDTVTFLFTKGSFYIQVSNTWT